MDAVVRCLSCWVDAVVMHLGDGVPDQRQTSSCSELWLKYSDWLQEGANSRKEQTAASMRKCPSASKTAALSNAAVSLK